MEEVWEDVVSADYYEISTTGLVRNKRTGKLLKGSISDCGYPRIALVKNGKSKSFLIHRLLLETFVGPCQSGMECRHLDGNRLNFSLDNLKWGTRSENCRDAVLHKTRYKPDTEGSKNGNSKLSDKQVLEIDFLITKGIGLGEITKRFGVSFTTVWSIKMRKTYKYLWNKPATPESDQ